MVLALFSDWGWDAHIETFQVLYPTPISRDSGTDRADALQGHADGAAYSRRCKLVAHSQ